MQPSGPSTVHDPACPQVRRRLARPVTVAVLALAMLELPVLVAPGARAASLPTDLPLAAPPAGHPEVPQLPAPTGPHRVDTLTMHLVDRSRPDPLVPAKPVGELMVQLWYPSRHTGGYPYAPFLPTEAARQLAAVLGPPIELLAAVPTSGREGAPLARGRRRYPVVLYSPGLGFPRALGTTLVQDLASHGFVVVAIDHTYDAAVVEFPGGRVERGVEPDPLLALRARVDDVGFVLGELARINAGHVLPGFRHRLDLARVGMVGHSLGGAAAANAIAAGLPIRAGLNMDGRVWPPASNPGVVIERPFLQFGAESHNRYTDPTWAAFWANLHGWRRELQIDGAGHNDFTDLGLLLDQLGLDKHALFPGGFGSIRPARAIEIQQAYVRAFFTQHLRGRHQRLLDRPSRRFPEVIFVGSSPPRNDLSAAQRRRNHLPSLLDRQLSARNG
jgi:dienelactone hydrolase